MTNFLFCFLKPDKRAPAVNQRRHIEVCKKLGCGYLNLEGETPACTCEPSIEYFLAPPKKKHEMEEVQND